MAAVPTSVRLPESEGRTPGWLQDVCPLRSHEAPSGRRIVRRMMDGNYPSSSFADALAAPAQNVASWAYDRGAASAKPRYKERRKCGHLLDGMSLMEGLDFLGSLTRFLLRLVALLTFASSPSSLARLVQTTKSGRFHQLNLLAA